MVEYPWELLFVLPAVFALSERAAADPITLDFGSLPSSQGWTFTKSATGSHSSDTEAGTFSVASSVLTMDTMGTGLVSPSGLGYIQTGVVNPLLPWTLEWRFRVTSYEWGGPLPDNHGATFAVSDGTRCVYVAASTTRLSIPDGTGGATHFTRDNTGYQTFRLEFTPDAGTGALRPVHRRFPLCERTRRSVGVPPR